jgi:hypothetical protein
VGSDETSSQLQRRELDAPGAIRPNPSEAIEEIAILVLRQTLQGYCPSGGIADEVLQLITTMGRNLRVGVKGKAVYDSDGRGRRDGYERHGKKLKKWRIGVVYPLTRTG